ncbi:PREDICTED: isovaleryl-CoA dehydrogenase, mitochondrial-like [Acropora digitifera]|uniref:isovaleryl-CoA dehydrogenase, mitochondrial-like n=1 Tax=Acropora digitifera TaxID=70779 RepID=UPI00077AD50C|nr:PREDICTED: isovaleryl-CoA dehydrogenase, mitochondrial-like [Acropora digitifera]
MVAELMENSSSKSTRVSKGARRKREPSRSPWRKILNLFNKNKEDPTCSNTREVNHTCTFSTFKRSSALCVYICLCLFLDDYYVLNGTKMWITSKRVAEVLVVYTKTDPNNPKPQHGITCFLIEKGMEGFSTTPKLDKLGMRGSNTCELVFEDCKVPGNLLLLCYYMYMYLVNNSKLKNVQMHKRNFEHTKDKVDELQIFKLLSARGKMSYVYSVARACDAGHVNTKDCAGVILYAAENATQVALDVIQILGGNGYINDYPTGRFVRDAKLYEIGAGTSEIRRWFIGDTLNSEFL